MTGDNQSRLCSHCDTNIHNLSEMSGREVTKLLTRNKGRVCVRMTRDADGKVQTNDRKFHQIKSKTRIAASFLSITLALTTVPFAQSAITKSSIENQSKTGQNLLTLTIADSNNAVIPNAQVKIINLETKHEQTGRSNENGELQFVIENLGNYEIVVDGISGFKQLKKTVELTKENLKMKLQIIGKMGTELGLTSINQEIIGTSEATIGTTISGRAIQSLPESVQNPYKLVLTPKTTKKKNTSQISFTIFDPNGAIIANAEVKLTNDKTKKEFIFNTNEQGVSYFSFLPRGRYKVEASSNGFIKQQRYLVVNGEVEPNIKLQLEVGTMIGVVADWSFEIPIFNSIVQGDFDVVMTYVRQLKSVNLKDESHNNLTMLHIALETDQFEIVKLLIDAGANINAKDKLGRTPIMLVDLSEENSSEIIKLFIGKGANVNIQNKDEDNQTLLMTACDDENLEIVKLLLEAGANPNLKDNDGETAMMKTDSEEIKNLLKQYGAKK